MADQIERDRFEENPPSAVHRQLSDAKSRSLSDRDFAQKSLPSQPATFQLEYDVRFYDISMRINDTNEIIYGRVGILAAATEDGVTTVDLDLHTAMSIDSIWNSSGNLGINRIGNVLIVTLDKAYNTGEEFYFDVSYQGHPVEGGFQAFSFDTRNGQPVMSSLSEPYFARTWWPCKDRMDDKADSFDIALEIRNDLYAASNGTLDSIINKTASTDVYYYSVRYPLVPYLFSVAISNYTVWSQEYVYNGTADTMPIIHHVYPDRYDYSLSRWGIIPTALDALVPVFGPYPFLNEKYGHANFEWGGGMEHQTVTSMGGSSFGFSEPVVVHELGHQWWGDMITCESWRDIWLNEGWASYSEALYYEQLNGMASYHTYMGYMAYGSGGTVYLDDTTDVWGIFTTLVYDKGAWVCHMLRGVLGDDAFFAGINAYYNSEHQYASATSQDFENVFEASSGVDLTWYFEDWLHGEYRPNYDYYIWSENADSGGFDNYVVINQVQTTNPQVFRMPFDLHLNGPDSTIRLFNDQREQTFAFHTDDSVNSIMLDPEDWVLKYSTAEQWDLQIVTTDSSLAPARRLESYNDTIEVRGGSGNNVFAKLSGDLPSGISLDADGILSGMTSDTGMFTFTLNVHNFVHVDIIELNLYVDPTGGLPGDLNASGGVDISDLTFMVNYLFLLGDPPPYLELADVTGNCEVDISDLTALVNYLFLDGPDLVMGCI